MSTICVYVFFFFKQKTAYEMRISDWSSDVCSSDLFELDAREAPAPGRDHRVHLFAQHFGSDAARRARRMIGRSPAFLNLARIKRGDLASEDLAKDRKSVV